MAKIAQSSVFFRAGIEVPPSTGNVVSAQWDFEGDAIFPVEKRYLSAK
jgi:hypothetical protein